ncbi:MAG: hypothetical protein A2V76_01755 [Candidatus Aminicenantes bacterium RBG_16_63_14]|nr:MAG: hypothetical protein A2V76_01755 [Candidatus Aminicenantes bacterium RBG_16_63_14]OGD27070.1 MAG: hypothetical protein A2V57_04125 [Candidatus Aminicenantes bacterium RBG_19FT_COMBO_65_30]
MKKKLFVTGLAVILPLAGLLLACLSSDNSADKAPAAPAAGISAIQFLPDELARREQWEEFIKTAEVIGSRQLTGPEAVTSPWVLTLKKGDVTHRGLWKNPRGRMGGFWEGWTYEIAAYLLDKHLGLGMVPPTVERLFRDERGSCQYWVDDCMSLKEREEKRIKMPPVKVFAWNRATYLQRFFDNLIANEDRHTNQILITPDWRMILIDHSRSFRTSGRFTKSLLYSAKHPEGPKLMSELPRVLVDKVKSLDFPSIKAVVGENLSDNEIRAVLIRRDLILTEIDRLVRANGENKVFY